MLTYEGGYFWVLHLSFKKIVIFVHKGHMECIMFIKSTFIAKYMFQRQNILPKLEDENAIKCIKRLYVPLKHIFSHVTLYLHIQLKKNVKIM